MVKEVIVMTLGLPGTIGVEPAWKTDWMHLRIERLGEYLEQIVIKLRPLVKVETAAETGSQIERIAIAVAVVVAVVEVVGAVEEIVGGWMETVVARLDWYLKWRQIVGFVSQLDHLEILWSGNFVSNFVQIVETVVPEVVEAVGVEPGLRWSFEIVDLEGFAVAAAEARMDLGVLWIDWNHL